jgi:soluble lytic murein transglycosylase-like protein
MTLTKRLQIGTLAVICAAALAAPAAAQSPHPLSDADAQRYQAAFDDVDRGDYIDAQMQSAEISDKSLIGYLSFRQLVQPKSGPGAPFEELTGWLLKFRDLPVANRIFALAAQLKPAGAADPPAPEVAGDLSITRTDQDRAAREAFFSGDVQRALALAPGAGDRWIAGLAAYRLKEYAKAQALFEHLARDPAQDSWTRSAAGFWGARSAEAQGDRATAWKLMQKAALSPATFYGMIAARRIEMAGGAAPPADPLGDLLVKASYAGPASDLLAFIEADARAHRAAALAQIGRFTECGAELKAGQSMARDAGERERWNELTALLGAPGVANRAPTRRGAEHPDYPTPILEPLSGFTLDRALVYAIVRQESAFNPLRVSPKGAVGLMQIVPGSAALATGDRHYEKDATPLLDPALNLRIGQDYLAWLMQRGVGPNILRTVAAYNGGPGEVLKTLQYLNGETDDLLVMESLPAAETRDYVQKVMAAYWSYRRIFGEDTRTLDALASGAHVVDARLDLNQPANPPAAQVAADLLQVGLR